MTTVSRTNQTSHTTVSGGGDWDHRLNRLLEDLQDSVGPGENKATSGNASEYREFRMTTSRRTNDEPMETVNEKWVEYGSRDGESKIPTGFPESITRGFDNTGTSSSTTYGSTSGSHHQHHHQLPPQPQPHQQQSQHQSHSSYSTSSSATNRFGGTPGNIEKSVNFSDDSAYNSASNRNRNEYSSSSSKMEFLTPANTTTILSSGPTSPNFGPCPSSSSPKVERKEFYSKASYTSLIKGGIPVNPDEYPTGGVNESSRTEKVFEEIIPSTQSYPAIRESGGSSHHHHQHKSHSSSSSTMENKRTFMESSSTKKTGIDDGLFHPPPQPLYSSTPLKSSSNTTSRNEYSSRELINNDRSITPPPKPVEGLKTPPLVRKILQSSTTGSSYKHEGKPPFPSYEDINTKEKESNRYYTATTSTQHTQREMSPVRRFPSPHPPRDYSGNPPKHLNELLATFDESYKETRHYDSRDGGGPHKTIPYGPGTRTVRIDENVQQRRIVDEESEITHRGNKQTNYSNPSYTGGGGPQQDNSVTGPPVYYPGQVFSGKIPENENMPSEKYPEKEEKYKPGKEGKPAKIKKDKGDKEGGGAVPVPVCLPVCCATPCSIV